MAATNRISDSRHRRFSLVSAAAFVGFCLTLAGCREEIPVTFEPNLVHAMKYQIKEGISMDQATKDTTWVVTQMFGTVDAPTLPKVVTEDEDLASVVSLERLQLAAGEPDAEGRGLYRTHCAHCHGVTGNGRGTKAALLTPYPRDYRMGIFKFKSTPRGAKPTRDDLARLIRGGIPGTAMIPIAKTADKPEIPTLSDEELQALVDYVIYLSMRGELERQLIDDGVMELDLEGGDRILDTELAMQLQANPGLVETFEKMLDADQDSLSEKEAEQLERYELYVEGWEIAEDYAADIAESWLEAEEEIIDVPQPPTGLPLAESREHFDELMKGDQAQQLTASVKRGRELFVGKIASCSKCHGETGLGNGQTTDYDEWTKDWTTRVGLKPEDRESLIPLLARGALPPVNAIPRNFAEGVFHGGSSSEDLYRRIMQGIDGTPMPAATFVEGQFEQDDVWSLINFIRSLQNRVEESPAPAPAA